MPATRWQPAAVDPCRRARNKVFRGTVVWTALFAAITVGLRSGQAPYGIEEFIQDGFQALAVVEATRGVGDPCQLVEVVANAAQLRDGSRVDSAG